MERNNVLDEIEASARQQGYEEGLDQGRRQAIEECLCVPNIIEEEAAAVHEAYLETCEKLGWHVRSENRVPYGHLSEEAKELDRATAKAVIKKRAEILQDD